MSTIPTIADFVDAVADDLVQIATDLAGAANYTDWRHSPPDFLMADSAPWLAVWSPETVHDLEGTIGGRGDFTDSDTLAIQWGISIGQYAEQGGAGRDSPVRDAIVGLVPLVERLRTYTSGLPGFTNQVLGTLTRTDRSVDRGFAWTATYELTITSVGAE